MKDSEQEAPGGAVVLHMRYTASIGACLCSPSALPVVTMVWMSTVWPWMDLMD